MSKKRRKRRAGSGHYCWCCGRLRPNERFSGRGHRRHLCKDCSKLGKAELAFRQRVKNIDCTLDFGGRVRRNRRAELERYLSHEDQRVREYAAEVQQLAKERRRALRESLDVEELEGERFIEASDSTAEVDPDPWLLDEPALESSDEERTVSDEEFEDIPF